MFEIKDIIQIIKQTKVYYIGAILALIGGLAYISLIIQASENGFHLLMYISYICGFISTVGAFLMILHIIFRIIDNLFDNN